MIFFKSNHKLNLQINNLTKTPKNEMDGGNSYIIGKKAYNKKTYESLLSQNLPINNLDKVMLKKNNPIPINNISSGMKINMLKLNNIGRTSVKN